jgi:hypothetical protein
MIFHPAGIVDENLTITRAIGDITGLEGLPDGRVDMRDVGLAARHFGMAAPPANPNWDLNEDMKIDMRDISIVARHFGEHYP